jgi:hypothetical protein
MTNKAQGMDAAISPGWYADFIVIPCFSCLFFILDFLSPFALHCKPIAD